jgi:hypothetical protein
MDVYRDLHLAEASLQAAGVEAGTGVISDLDDGDARPIRVRLG